MPLTDQEVLNYVLQIARDYKKHGEDPPHRCDQVCTNRFMQYFMSEHELSAEEELQIVAALNENLERIRRR